MSSCPRTAPRRRPWLAVSLVPLLLAASCTGPGPAASRAPAARAPARAPAASFAPFTSKLRVPDFTGSCPATAAPRYSRRTVVIPLRILTPSPVISQIFAGVCLNGHGPYPFIVDTGSSRTIVDAALARRLGLVSASAASGMHACGGTARDATVRLSAGPFVFGQDRQVVITGLASPSAPLMGILGAGELSSFGIDRIDYQAQTLTVPAPAAGGPAPASLSAGTSHRIRLQPSGDFQLMPAAAGDARGQLLLDTGAQGTTLTPAFARQARLARASPVTTRTYAGAGCTRPVTYYTARDWSIGGFTLAPQTVGSVPDFLAADGSLGSGTLQRYSPVVIDYRHHELLLGPLRPGT
ncbi:MAG: retroviral-like aspartic protease family protein [Trebonia sp.]